MSKDLGETLLANTDTIINNWIESIREDVNIESSKSLAYKAVRNSIPLVVEALATLLAESVEDREQKLRDKGWEHGIVRSEQGYDVAEIVREYSLLRKIIFGVLKPKLLIEPGESMLHKVELINSVLDRVVTLSLESFVETRLSELEQIHSQLLLTNKELTRLVNQQKEDISHMAHELKSPLNAIMGFSSLLLQQHRKTPQGSETSLSLRMTEKVVRNGRQLLRLINDILEVSRYETGNISLNIEAIEVRSLVQTVVETLEIAATQKNLEILLNCDCVPQQIQTDTIKLQQIITNVVGNAIRYTESGTITITCSSHESDRWSFTVTDTGIGISPKFQTQIFEPYYQVGSKSAHPPDSTGLGLAIVNKLVKLLQGEIDLTSELGKGSTFTVTFPLTLSR